MDIDVPWDVKWTSDFEDAVEELKQSGSWNHVRSTIEKIINDPARTGRYKDGTLKGCRTTHIKEKVIGWQVKPGVQSNQQEKVEEVLFLFIVHHDDMGFGISSFSPVEKSSEFRIKFSYYSGVEIGRVIHDVFSVIESIDGTRIKDPDYREEVVVLEGAIPPNERGRLEAVLPDPVEIEYEESSILD